ncbi:MAG: hypothetical protein E7354_01520 [Clostridiales bacterium]|nr:hypothetical protein [Clostridiales bacterium]
MKYANRLTIEQIHEIFGANGLVVLDDLDTLIKESNEAGIDGYYIKCGRVVKKEPSTFEQIRDMVYKKTGLSQIEGFLPYSNDSIDIYAMSDFTLHRLFALDFPNESDYALQDYYVKTMSGLFKEDGYNSDYNAFADDMTRDK